MPPRVRYLRTWGEIAAHLGISVNTAVRWTQRYGLPVRKGPGRTVQVIADPADLDHWQRTHFTPLASQQH